MMKGGLFTVNDGPQGDARKRFWGVSCEGGKAYQQVVNSSFHLTMAVLDPNSYDSDVRDKTVTLNVVRDGQVFLLCVLTHGLIQQVNLNLIFGKGDNVLFTVRGCGTVHLTGYTIIDSSDGATFVDNPVSELESERDDLKRSAPQVNGVKPKIKKRAISKLMQAYLGELGDDDEDDSDFYAYAEEDEEESDDDDEDVDSEDLEIDEDELNDVIREKEEIVTPPKSEGSQKRKLGHVSFSEKRMKREKDEMPLENNESDSDEDGLDSSIGHTPMPKKLDESAKQKKKNKKKKRLSDVSNLDKSMKVDEKSEEQLSEESTSQKKGKKVHPVVSLEQGLKYQDVIVGRGPEATSGKAVSVFYMGRLENKTIFDCRTPPKRPFSFRIGVPEVIKGLDLGVRGMRVGGQRKLCVPPQMGYGSRGLTGVPPNSTLYFTVELQSVNP